MECIFHIGVHKTGTTSFQALLEENRARLGEGVALVNHRSDEMARLRRACERFEKCRDEASGRWIASETAAVLAPLAAAGCTRAILSSETLCGPIPTPRRKGRFYGTAPAIVGWLRTGAAGHAARFCLYLRDEADWRSSLLRHLAHSRGVGLTPAEFDALPGLAGFSLTGLAEDIRPAAGELMVFRMEDDLPHRLGPGTGLLHALGYDEAALAAWRPVGVRNPGVSAEYAARLRHPLMRLLPARLRKYAARLAGVRRPAVEGGR